MSGFTPAWRYRPMDDQSPMPFGKYRDKMLKDIPIGYWEHLAAWDGLYHWPALAEWIEKKLFGERSKPKPKAVTPVVQESELPTHEEAVAAMRKFRESL